MENRLQTKEKWPPLARGRVGPTAAQHLALEALGPYDAAAPLSKTIPPREDMREARLLPLALLPLASWGLGVLFDLPAGEMLSAVIVATLVAGALALRR